MDKPLATINYKTADGKRICVEVSTAVKELLEQSDRQIRSQGRKDRRYLDYAEYIDGVTNSTMMTPQEDVADLLIKMELIKQLHAAMDKLTETQRRRLILYFYHDMTYRRIAEIERVDHKAVVSSVARAIQILKDTIEN